MNRAHTKKRGLWSRLDRRVERTETHMAARVPVWDVAPGLLVVLLATRLSVAATWAWGAATKPPPGFGWLENSLRSQVEHNIVPGYSWFVEHVMLPNITMIGWTAFIVEAYLAIVLLLGLATRLNGLIATLWGLNIAIGSMGVPLEPMWVLVPFVLLPMMAAEGRSGRVLGLDAALHPRLGESNRPLLRFIGRRCM